MQIDQKMKQDEVVRGSRRNVIKQSVNLGSQYEERNQLKRDESLQRRGEGADERKKIEESVRVANEAEIKRKELRRSNFRQLT